MLPRYDVDVLVVGGGPVGLHAALKAAVLRHTVLLADKGVDFSRVSQAGRIANIPGSPGISGPELLARLRKDLASFAGLSGEQLVTLLERTEVTAVERTAGGDGEGDGNEEGDGRQSFRATLRAEDGSEAEARARVVVLATGLVDRKPGVSAFWREGHRTVAPFLHREEVGYCLLCEGWSLTDAAVAVVGCSGDSAHIALDVRRHFGGEVTLLTDGSPLSEDAPADELAEAGVRVDERVITRYDGDAAHVRVVFDEGPDLVAEKLFFTLGFYRVNNELAVQLGAATTPEGYVRTDDNSEALDAEGRRIPGLFVVGDLRAGRWKQVVVGWGDAETAIITAYAKRLPD